MKSFLHIIGALAIGAMIAVGLTFPVLLIGAVIGYFIIQESMSSGSNNKNPSIDIYKQPTQRSSNDPWISQDTGTW